MIFTHYLFMVDRGFRGPSEGVRRAKPHWTLTEPSLNPLWTPCQPWTRNCSTKWHPADWIAWNKTNSNVIWMQVQWLLLLYHSTHSRPRYTSSSKQIVFLYKLWHSFFPHTCLLQFEGNSLYKQKTCWIYYIVCIRYSKGPVLDTRCHSRIIDL